MSDYPACGCGRPRDDRGRCWHCCDRLCSDCRRTSTGSAFIELCLRCAHLQTMWDDFEAAPKPEPTL